MPKIKLSESVLHDWVHELPFQMQALLLTSMRGPDGNSKFNSAKKIIRYLRGVVCKPAGIWDGLNNDNFMWGDYGTVEEAAIAGTSEIFGWKFEIYANVFWGDRDKYPHHFIMHLVHCAEVVGYCHPDLKMRKVWCNFYLDACDAFHMNAEIHEQMWNRLNDFGVGVHSEK